MMGDFKTKMPVQELPDLRLGRSKTGLEPIEANRRVHSKRSRKLSRKQQAIEAFLTCSTIDEVAAATGIPTVTIRRWQQEPQFQAELREAQHRVFKFNDVKLQVATGHAVDTLIKNLSCGQPAVQVRAALGILEQCTKNKELLYLESRLTELECRLLKNNEGGL